jgi:hypothetical protein
MVEGALLALGHTWAPPTSTRAYRGPTLAGIQLRDRVLPACSTAGLGGGMVSTARKVKGALVADTKLGRRSVVSARRKAVVAELVQALDRAEAKEEVAVAGQAAAAATRAGVEPGAGQPAMKAAACAGVVQVAEE